MELIPDNSRIPRSRSGFHRLTICDAGDVASSCLDTEFAVPAAGGTLGNGATGTVIGDGVTGYRLTLV